MCKEYVGEFEKVGININKYDKETQKKFFETLGNLGINFFYENY